MPLRESAHGQTDEQAGDKSTKMAHVIHIGAQRGDSRSEKKIYADKENHAAGESAFLSGGDSQIAELDSRQQSASDAKDSTRRTNFHVTRVMRDAEQSAADSSKQIDKKGLQLAKEPLRELSQTEEAPHIYGDVEESAVDKTSGDQTPVLA